MPTAEQMVCRECLPAYLRFVSDDQRDDMELEMKAARAMDWLARTASLYWIEFGTYEINWNGLGVTIGVQDDQQIAGRPG